jgi:hypothetical protein
MARIHIAGRYVGAEVVNLSSVADKNAIPSSIGQSLTGWSVIIGPTLQQL